MIIDDGAVLPMPTYGDGEVLSAKLVPGSAAAMDDMSVTLQLSDMLPDANGEIVILGDGADSHLSIVTELRLLETGIAAQHLTESGVQVEGLTYWVFEDGTTVYHSHDVTLHLDHQIV
jgi:hypothetical protein